MIGGTASPRATTTALRRLSQLKGIPTEGSKGSLEKLGQCGLPQETVLPLSHKGPEAPSSLHHNKQSHERLKHVRSRRSALQLDLAISRLRHFQVWLGPR